MTMPAQRHLEGFLRALTHAGITTIIGRRIDFFRALAQTPLTSIDDLYWVARVTLVSGFDQIEVFDAQFDMWFRGAEQVVELAVDAPEESDANNPPGGASDKAPVPVASGEGTGREASLDELLAQRTLRPTSHDEREICRRIGEAASKSLPLERARRTVRSHRSGRLDMRRILGQMRRSGGEVIELSYRQRPWRFRRVLMLIDISGSLKATSPDALRAAHALKQVAPRMEVFTFGTQLTRVTPALACDDIDGALEHLSDFVFDFDGGTRIGPSFQTLLANGRFRMLARGALVIVISDGLERGEVDTMRKATDLIARLAHRLVWLTPLMSDPAYRPATRGMQAILGSIDRLGDASSLGAFLKETESLDVIVERRPRRTVAAAWKRHVQGDVRPEKNWIGRNG
jgi:hypothetical protein